MSKRSAESNLTRENEDNEEEYNESKYIGDMPIADAETLMNRKIRKVKRKGVHPTQDNQSKITPTADSAIGSGFVWTGQTDNKLASTAIPFSFGEPTIASSAGSVSEGGGFKFEAPSSFQFSFAPTTTSVEKVASVATPTTISPIITTPINTNGEKKTVEADKEDKSPFAFAFGTDKSAPGFNFDLSASSFGKDASLGSAFTSFSNTEAPVWGSESKPNEEDLSSNIETEGVGGDFKVVHDVKFSEEPVKTGEEDEVTLFQDSGKLFELIKTGEAEKTAMDWKERGIGLLKLNTQKDGTKPRLIMRKENVLSVILNSLIFVGMKCSKRGDKSVVLNVSVVDERNQGHMTTFLVKFQKAESTDKLIRLITEEAAKLK